MGDGRFIVLCKHQRPLGVKVDSDHAVKEIEDETVMESAQSPTQDSSSGVIVVSKKQGTQEQSRRSDRLRDKVSDFKEYFDCLQPASKTEDTAITRR